MRNISSAFSRALANDKRDYQSRLVITLADNTILNVNNTQIWDGGLKIEDAVSADNVFQVGAAIINQGTFIINNIYGDFSEYAFDGAKVVAYTGLTNLDDNTDEEIKLGTYIVDETNYNGSLITLTCVDNMSKFDKAYDTNLSYPTTLFSIVNDACTKCGVILSNSSLNFPHKNYVVTTKPSSENTTFRQVIAWAAQIACCYARCNSDGYLEIKWYDTDELDNMSSWLDGGVFDQTSGSYETGDDADGGSFNPWSIGDVYDGGSFSDTRNTHFIMSSYTSNIATDNVVITGVKVIKKIKGDGSSDAFEEYTSGTAGYIIIVEDNEFIDGVHGQDVANWIGEQLNGLSFRKAEITHPSDPSIEAGDVGIYFDTRDNYYPIVISSTEFVPGNSQRTSSSAETPRKNSAQRFSEATRNYVEIRKRLSQQKTEWEEAEEELSDRIDNAGGLYCTEVTEGTATKTYYHNKPILEESDIRMLFSDVGFTLTADGGQTWYGMTVDGTMIAAILTASGVNADWINSGAISIKDEDDNITFYADTNTGAVEIYAKNSDNVEAFYLDSVTGTLRIAATSFTLNGRSISNEIARTQYGSCTVAANVAEKTVSCSGFVRNNGSRISVKFTNANTANNPTLNVNNTGAAYIRAYGSNLSSSSAYNWTSNSIVDFVYDGTYWVISDSGSLSKVNTLDTSLTQLDIFNRLTNNGQTQGIYLDNNKLYINADYMKSGTIDSRTIKGSMIHMNPYTGSYVSTDGWLFKFGILGYSYNVAGKIETEIRSGVANIDTVGHLDTQSDDKRVVKMSGGYLSIGRGFFNETYGEIAYRHQTFFIQQRSNVTYDSIEFLFMSDKPTLTANRAYFGFERNNTYYPNPYVATTLYADSLVVYGTKSKAVDTDFGTKLAYCYEMASPMYGDIGGATIGEDGTVTVDIDQIFQEYIYDKCEYYVFLQNEGIGESYISKKDKSYFVISGTPGLKVAWELKARQIDSYWKRTEDVANENGDNIIERDYETEALEYTVADQNYLEEAQAEVFSYINQNYVMEDYV